MGLVACFLLVVAGCATDQPSSIFEDISTSEASLTGAEFEARVNNFAERFPTRIDALAFPLAMADPASERSALLLTIRSSEEAVRATYYRDPMATFVSLWTLCYQIELYYESGDGATTFTPEGRVELTSAFWDMGDELEALVRATGRGEIVDGWRASLQAWVEANPIVGETLSRPSPVPLLAELKRPRGKGLLAATSTIEQGMRDIGTRIEIMQAQLPRMMVLRSALYIESLTGNLTLPELVERLDRLIFLAEEIPDIVDAQRLDTLAFARDELTRVLEAVDAERGAVFDEIGEERVAVLGALREERIAIMHEVAEERRAILADVEVMRAAIVADVDVQRIDTLDRLDAMLVDFGMIIETQRASLTSEIDATVASTVDGSIKDVYWQTLKLLLAIFVGIALLIVLVRILWSPRRVPA